ncbi:MAG TPA: cytochrome c peroxidase [Gemmatimonadaceae bacterium]
MPGKKSIVLVVILMVTTLSACTDRPTAPAERHAGNLDVVVSSEVTPQTVRELAAARGIVPLPPKPKVRRSLVLLGQALAFDKVLSGNRDISCMTCHLPQFATGDGRSLSIGQGGTGLGPPRSHSGGVFIPRNAPPLFNLEAMKHLFWDGRVQVDGSGQLHTPAGSQLTPQMVQVFEFGPASTLAMFPVTNRSEMRGDTDNDLGEVFDDDFTGIWSALMRRLGAIPEYRAMFQAAYPGTKFEQMTFAHASNAIGAFMVDQLSFADSPWDRFLAGNDKALTSRQLEGAQTFLTLKCSTCHNGATFSDEQFHNVAVPQIGPGQGNGESLRDDFGRMNVTGNTDDRYRFRTSPLRNVELTGPFGHDGAITTLREFLEHYSESDLKLMSYDPQQLEPSLRESLLLNSTSILAQRDPLLEGVVLSPDLIDKLMDYMQALTDNAARNLSRVVPTRVPSGLKVDRP